MAKNISLLGADYPDVPAVQLPQTGGGTATFYDIGNWETVQIGTPSSGSLIDGSYLIKNDVLKLAILSMQVNGNSAGATVPLNISVLGSIDKPIYGYNAYNNIQVDCVISSTGLLTIIQGAALVRVYAIIPLA